MPRREFKELRLRAFDCENLGFQVTFVTCSTDEERQECKDNAQAIKDRFFPDPPKYDKLGPDDVLWGADENCDHEIIYPIGGGMKCRKCAGWFCY